MPSDDHSVKYARTACFPCRKSKRRCDKKIPSCDLCIRRDLACGYPTRLGGSQATGAVQDFAAPAPEIHWSTDSWNTHLSESVGSHPSQSLSPLDESTAPAIYFIAPHIFQQAQMTLLRSNGLVPSDVSCLIGDASSIRDIACKFFIDIHRWFPIVEKRGFFARLLDPLANRQLEVSLLALSMKLCCTALPSEHDGGSSGMELYRTAKRFYQRVEAQGILSIRVLQAGTLIAVYELAQAIFPAAYLTVGACVRYGLALGIDRLSPLADSDAEEQRRVWWALLILDRFLSFGDPLRPLVTEDPAFDAYLPVDDDGWDNGDMAAEATRISTGFTLKMGGFARLAQATYLFSQARRSISAITDEDDPERQESLAQLRRTLLALVHAADREAEVRRLEFCAPSALSLSTILLLEDYQFAAQSNRDQTMSPEAQIALDRLSKAATSYTIACPIYPDAADTVPLFVIHSMYQAACLLQKSAQRPLDGETRAKLDAISDLLKLLNPRWRVAGVYAGILEAQEMVASTGYSTSQGNSVCPRFSAIPPL